MRAYKILILTFVLMVSLFYPVHAEQSDFIKGSDLSISVRNFLCDNGVSIEDSDIIELTEAVTEERNVTAIKVTNAVNENVRESVVVLDNSDGLIQSIDQLCTTSVYSQQAEYPPISWDGRYVVTATAYFNRYTYSYTSGWYRPRSVSFSYTQYESCDIDYIAVKYITTGIVYSYPEFVVTDDDTIDWIITAFRDYPVANSTYTATNPYASNRVIYTNNGGPYVGNYLTFIILVDGASDTYTVHF